MAESDELIYTSSDVVRHTSITIVTRSYRYILDSFRWMPSSFPRIKVKAVYVAVRDKPTRLPKQPAREPHARRDCSRSFPSLTGRDGFPQHD
jgi:hypothetical protein